jgi:hypothetical protein
METTYHTHSLLFLFGHTTKSKIYDQVLRVDIQLRVKQPTSAHGAKPSCATIHPNVRLPTLMPESSPAKIHPTRSKSGRTGPDPTSPLSMSCPEPKSGHDSRARRAWLADRDKSASISMWMSLIRRRPSRDRPLRRRWLERGPLETSGPRGESTAFPVTLIGQPLGCRKS